MAAPRTSVPGRSSVTTPPSQSAVTTAYRSWNNCSRSIRVDAQGNELLFAMTKPEADFETPVAELVQHGHLFRELRGKMKRKGVGQYTQANVGGALAGGRDPGCGRGGPVVLHEMALSREGVAQPRLIRQRKQAEAPFEDGGGGILVGWIDLMNIEKPELDGHVAFPLAPAR